MPKSHDYTQKALEVHERLRGKITVRAKADLKNEDDLSVFYTPGVGAVSSELAKKPQEIANYTIKKSTVAVVSDGSAVLGLGNVGPAAALPVMEGKAMLFSQLAGLDAFPIVLDTQDPEQIIETVVNIAPVFGGINLEDIAAPQCFQIERELEKRLDIPVIHDDQHATAIAVLAGLINALKVVGKQTEDIKVVVIGAGAAGNGVIKLLHGYGIKHIIAIDRGGIISAARNDLDINKQELLTLTNPDNISGGLNEAMAGSDVVIGLSQGKMLNKEHIASMAKEPIVMAMSNPTPEIMPSVAFAAGAAIVATGRSDFANQINNVLVFPGMFKGAMESGIKKITINMKLVAARNLAAVVRHPTREKIIPSVFDKDVVPAIAAAIQREV